MLDEDLKSGSLNAFQDHLMKTFHQTSKINHGKTLVRFICHVRTDTVTTTCHSRFSNLNVNLSNYIPNQKIHQIWKTKKFKKKKATSPGQPLKAPVRNMLGHVYFLSLKLQLKLNFFLSKSANHHKSTFSFACCSNFVYLDFESVKCASGERLKIETKKKRLRKS